MKNKKGFTLIELLAVIIILGVLMLIAIPSVTEYISNSRRKAYISTAGEYLSAATIKVNSLELPINDPNTTYYVPISSIQLEKGGRSPYGDWEDAYIVVTFDGTNYSYYWTSLDEEGNAILLTYGNKLTSDSIVTNISSLDLTVGVGTRTNIVLFAPDGTIAETLSASTTIEDGGSLREGTTAVPIPIITLIGSSTVNVEYGSTYTDLGATASDDEDGDLTDDIVTTNNVNTNVLGTYTVTYNVSDSSNNDALEVIRTVNVVDTTKPVITLNGLSSIEVGYGTVYTDLGATATDNVDGNISGSIVVTNNVNTNVLGTYTVTYNVKDSSDNNAIAVTRTVSVIDIIANPGYIAGEGVNAPMMIDGLTAIKWNTTSSTWDTVADPNNDTSWYNYSSKQWANAKSADGSMWVWIPRYAYQIATNYHTSTAGTINIKFLKGKTNTASDDSSVATTPTYSGSSQTNYIVHPAFKFGTTELTGIWVAKFELSGTTSSLDSKPNVASLKSVTLGNMFTASRNMETNSKYGWGLASGLNADGTFTTDTNNLDTHMIKSSEWGVIAYLAQSTYGKNAEITINSSPSFITGGGAYVTNVGQSTTGNIYGIYDMSGGSCEYTMGNYNNTPGSSGLTPSNINSKYINIYSTTGTGYDASNYGDAIYETSSSASGSAAWYGDGSVGLSAASPWLEQGGYYGDGSIGGLFNFYGFTGAAHAGYSWRTVLIIGVGL